MGYFDGLISAAFKKNDEGAIFFYPYGKFGMGYILSEEDESSIKKFLRSYYTISFSVIILTVIFFGIFSLLLLFFFLPFYSIKIKKFLNNKNGIEEKITFEEISRNMAFSMGLPTTLLLFLGTILLTVGSIIVLLKNDKLLGIVGILFFGFSCAILLQQFIFSIHKQDWK